MFRRLRENGPALLVPLAWTFVTAVHAGLVGTYPLLVAHAVMVALLVGFVALSWAEMADGVLRAWRTTILAGVPVTAAGLVGLAVPSTPAALLWLSVVGWMLLPVPALVYTGRRTGAGASGAYLAGAALSVVGAVVYVLAMLGVLVTLGPVPGAIAGLTLVNAGQTAGILDAVLRY